MGTFLFKTDNVTVNLALTTFTHGLGVAPAGEDGAVMITMRTSTGVIYVSASSSQVVVLQSTLAGVTVDVTVYRFHSLVK